MYCFSIFYYTQVKKDINMKRQEIIDAIAKNTTQKNVDIVFLTSGGEIRTKSIPIIDDYNENNVVLYDVTFQYARFPTMLRTLLLDYSKIIAIGFE